MVFGLFGDKGVDISIETDRPDGAYRPGETVVVTITLASDKGGNVREVRAGLVLWERYQAIEEGRDRDGDRREQSVWHTDERWIMRESLVPGTIPVGFRETYRFDWTIPSDGPAPCAGELIQIRWLIKVTVDRAMAKDVNEELELKIAASPPGTAVEQGWYGEVNDTTAALQLWLTGLEYAGGDTLRGRLVVEPRKDQDAREVRVELTRNEVVNRGIRQNVREQVEHKLQLAEKLKLSAGTPLEYDFELSIPETVCPSHQTEHGWVEWAVKATVDRAWTGDLNSRQTISVYNAPGGA